MKILELFAGTRSISRAFERKGHTAYTVEWDKKFDNITLYDDVNNLTPARVIELCGGVPDVIWASPDCTTYSVAAISYHRYPGLIPKTDYAKFCDETNTRLIKLIKDINPKLYFIENPRGGMRKMPFMEGLPRYTVT
jgi:site-specific DNA-cytosine methylase